jgi:hypothetical protein
VRVDNGPLEGLLGVLVADKGSYRVVVSLSLLQRSVAVEIDRASVTVVKKAIRQVRDVESECNPLPEAVPV